MARKRLLLIDGDETFAHELAAAAAGYGFDASISTNSNDGWDAAVGERPDLIVVNVEPPTNGWSVCSRLKKDEEMKSIPVVLTSSTSTEDTFEKHRKLKTRADEYLLKPYTVDDLVRVAGGLVGLPDPEEYAVTEEPLEADDEALSFGDLDTADDAIAVESDEPFEDAAVLEETGTEELPALDEDPLLADDALDADPLAGFDADSPVDADGTVDPLAGVDDETLVADEDLSAFSEDGEAVEAAGEDDLAAFEQSFDSITPNADGDGVTGAHDPSYDEAPLEVPAEEAGDGGYDALGGGYEFDGGAQSAELEAKVAQLEAEIEGYRASESGRDEEAARLREEIARRDREAADLREQLAERDRTLADLRDQHGKLGTENAKATAEKRKHEATLKALTAKAEQLALAGKKQERELAQAKEEAKEVAPLRARVNELEVAAETANEQLFELDSTREQLAALQTEAEGLRSDLAEARGTAERALGNAGSLQERLDTAEEQLRVAQEHAAALEAQLAQARTAALHVAELLTVAAA